MKKGKVYIIGAGPGDPGLITLKGIRCLHRCDVVIYDHLASDDLLKYAPEGARRVYVGKKGGDHTLPQDEINGLLVREALEGNVVARLKGGDPFIFGRGGEEAEVLEEAGIPFEVIPGVTSAISVPAYAGIPLTHRDYTSTLAFVTGHENPTKGKSGIDWDKLAGIGTLVFLMGVKNLSFIASSLIQYGRRSDTPAALIRWGTTSDQETLTGTLADIAEKAAKKGFTPPAILVVGKVVDLRPRMNWFETKPLWGRGIVITRPEEQAGEFSELLAEEGARVIYFPTIEIIPPETWQDVDRILAGIGDYDWIIFTSANGVRFFFRRLREIGGDLRDLKGVSVCTIGPATAAAIEKMGIRVDLVPRDYLSEGIIRAFQDKGLKGKKILLPRAEIAGDILPEGLKTLGAMVDVVTVYRTVRAAGDRSRLETLVHQGKVEVVTFTSPSTVVNFKAIVGEDFRLPGSVRIACIGPVTAAAAETHGFKVDILQERYTIPGMVEALVEYFKGEKNRPQ